MGAYDDILGGGTAKKRAGRYDDILDESRFGEKVNTATRSVPRQLGLTVRSGVGGLADAAGILANPVAATLNMLGMNVPRLQDTADRLMDMAGVPNAETPTERVVADASRMLAGGGGMVKGAQVVGRSVPLVSQLAARPGLQASSAVGAGLAGGVTRETGGDPTSQFVASLAGGLVAPAAVSGVARAGRGVNNLTQAVLDRRPHNIQITVKTAINNAIEDSGYKVADIPKAVIRQLEDDAAAAARMGDLSPDAMRRLVDYRLVGATPLRGNLTLNPVDLTRQHNLAKVGANSMNPKLQSMAMRQHDNTGRLISGLNEMGANTTDDAYSGGRTVMDSLRRREVSARRDIGAAYNAARDTQGRSAPLDHVTFTNRANDLIDQAMVGGALPPGVRSTLNKVATGEIPLTVEIAEQFKTQIGNLQRASNDGQARMALGLVRQALDDAPLVPSAARNSGNLPTIPGSAPAGNMQIGQESIDAFNRARRLNRNWMGLVEKVPALKAVVDGVEPDKFVQTYIVGGGGKSNYMDVARLKGLIRSDPGAMQAVRGQILSHLKARATSGKPDEAMLFSQSGYNNALSAIGDRKLSLFFSPDEINKMRSIGKVALYEQVQPSGSAVNNSNTAAMALANVFDWIARNPLLNSTPLISQTVPPTAKYVGSAIQGMNISNVPGALRMPPPAAPASQRLPLPLLMTPGLLEDRRN